MLRGKTVAALGYTGSGTVPDIVAIGAQSPGFAGIPTTTLSANVTFVEPEMLQPAVAVTVTTPPAFAYGMSVPAAIVPGGVSSARVAVQASCPGGTGAMWPSSNAPVAVNTTGTAALPSRFTVE